MGTGRKGPIQHASETPIGTIKKGNNGHYWMVIPLTTTSNVWIEVSEQKPRIVKPFYNGEEFNVVIGERNVFTFHNNVFVHKTKYKSLMIPSAEKHTYSTILIKLTSKRYIYIDGHYIGWFQTDGDVLDYKSPFGNSYVPYAYARTAKSLYLIQESVRLDWSPEMTDILKDPYMYYYRERPSASLFKLKKIYNAWDKHKS